MENETSQSLSAGAVSDPDNPPWGIGGAALAFLVSSGSIFVIPAIAVLPYLLLSAQQSPEPLDVKAVITSPTGILIQILSVFPAHFITLAVIWGIVTGVGRRSFTETIGLGWSPRFGVLKSAGLALVLFVVAMVIITLFPGGETQIDQLVKSSTGARYATAILATLTAPVVEEFVYRGVVFSGVRKQFGMMPSVLIVSSLFALVHVAQYYNNLGVIAAISLLSVTLTLVRAHTGKILPCIVIHMVFNGVQSVGLVAEPFISRYLEKTPGVIHALTGFLVGF